MDDVALAILQVGMIDAHEEGIRKGIEMANERWIADLETMVLSERQPDGSYKDIYKMLPLEPAPPPRDALDAILASPHGCVFCDSGKLRNPAKGHDPKCGFYLAERAGVR